MSEYIEFLERIKTYSFDKWTLRSSKITPYHLASWGFSCIAEDTFQCCMCQQQISAAHLPFQSEIEEQDIINVDLLVKNFFGSIMNVHKEECLYSQKHHNSSVFFSLTDEFLNENMEELYTIVYNTYEQLDFKGENGNGLQSGEHAAKYPLLDISFLNIIPQQYHFLLSEDQKYVNIKSLDVRKTLAAFAWRYEEDSTKNRRTLSCDYCGRTVSLSSYQTTEGRYMKIVQQKDASHTFNPFEEHKYFCKWSSAQILSNEESNETESIKGNNENGQTLKSINGWNICINYLLDQFTYQNKKKKTFETVNEIHKMQDEIKKLQTDFKSFESTISEKYTQIINECDSLNIKSVGTHSQFKEKLQQNRQSLDDILKDLNLSKLLTEPNKKVKLN